MVKVLLIRQSSESVVNGISVYCNALYDLFKDDIEIEILPVRNYPIYKAKLFHQIFKWKEFRKSVSDSGSDIIHVNGYASFTAFQAFLVASLLKKKVVFTPHWHPYNRMRHPFLAKSFFTVFLSRFVRRADAIVSFNDEDSSYFKKYNDNVIRIPHWNRLEYKENYSISKNPKMILFVGRFNAANKGFEHLYKLPEGKYEIHCVGKGQEFVDKRSDMVFHINISNDELETLYRQASLLVVPSLYESFSYVALEAISAGTPVVLSDGVRIGDYIKEYDWCKIFEYGNYSQFADAVASTIGKSVDKKVVDSIFSKAEIRERYKELYLKVVMRGRC